MEMFKELYKLEKQEKYIVGRNTLIPVKKDNPLINIFQTKTYYGTIYIIWLGYNKMSKKIYDTFKEKR